jgi:hypothetical protein
MHLLEPDKRPHSADWAEWSGAANVREEQAHKNRVRHHDHY